MTTTSKDPILVVIQLTGGNDYLNTVIPYGDGRYHDNRPTVGIAADQVLPIDDHFGFNPALPEFKQLYDAGKMAVINGNRLSHAQPLPLPQHGHLAHLRAGKSGDRGLAGPRH